MEATSSEESGTRLFKTRGNSVKIKKPERTNPFNTVFQDIESAISDFKPEPRSKKTSELSTYVNTKQNDNNSIISKDFQDAGGFGNRQIKIGGAFVSVLAGTNPFDEDAAGCEEEGEVKTGKNPFEEDTDTEETSGTEATGSFLPDMGGCGSPRGNNKLGRPGDENEKETFAIQSSNPFEDSADDCDYPGEEEEGITVRSTLDINNYTKQSENETEKQSVKEQPGDEQESGAFPPFSGSNPFEDNTDDVYYCEKEEDLTMRSNFDNIDKQIEKATDIKNERINSEGIQEMTNNQSEKAIDEQSDYVNDIQSNEVIYEQSDEVIDIQSEKPIDEQSEVIDIHSEKAIDEQSDEIIDIQSEIPIEEQSEKVIDIQSEKPIDEQSEVIDVQSEKQSDEMIDIRSEILIDEQSGEVIDIQSEKPIDAQSDKVIDVQSEKPIDEQRDEVIDIQSEKQIDEQSEVIDIQSEKPIDEQSEVIDIQSEKQIYEQSDEMIDIQSEKPIDEQSDKVIDIQSVEAIDEQSEVIYIQSEKPIEEQSDKVIDIQSEKQIDEQSDKVVDIQNEKPIEEQSDKGIDIQNEKPIDERSDYGVDLQSEKIIDKQSVDVTDAQTESESTNPFEMDDGSETQLYNSNEGGYAPVLSSGHAIPKSTTADITTGIDSSFRAEKRSSSTDKQDHSYSGIFQLLQSYTTENDTKLSSEQNVANLTTDFSQSFSDNTFNGGQSTSQNSNTTISSSHNLSMSMSKNSNTASSSHDFTNTSEARDCGEMGVTRGESCEQTLAADSSDVGEDVVVVTGGSGFLGQHVVKMLQTRAPHVKEIRVLDMEPFTQKLDYKASKPVKALTGSITDADFVTSSLEGATSVIHIAGLVSFGTFPDIEGMREVNVTGTQNIVKGCLARGVSRLIFCSTVDVVVGHQSIKGGDEDSTMVPPDFLFPGYPETKYQAECLVIDAAKTPRGDKPPLQTVSLRPNVMYGELDPYYVTSALRTAQQRNGVLSQVGDGKAMFQQAYVGNTAWAFVCADVAMKTSPDLTSQVFFIPDHTPIQNSFNFMRPYLEARGFKLSERHIPYSLVYGALFASEKVAHLLSPLKKLNLPSQSYSIAYINTDLYFRGNKARQLLKYEPLFTPRQARIASLEYYKTVPL